MISDYGLSLYSNTVAIGFSASGVSLTRAPGWEPESWGYHGDDGNVFASQNVGKHYGPPFAAGDTIGCGVNFRTGTAFFTRNGKHLGKPKVYTNAKGRFSVVALDMSVILT